MPQKPKLDIPTGEHVDEVSMVEYESTRGSSSKGAGGASNSFQYEEDDVEEPSGGQRVECNTH